MECQQPNHVIPCKGKVRRTKYGMLCYAHAYRAYLQERCGHDINEDDYGAKDEYEGTMFADVEGGE